MNQNVYKALAEQLYVKAKSMRGDEMQPYAKKRGLAPVNAPFDPTGIAKLDTLVNALGITFKYGSDEANNNVDPTGRSVSRAFDGNSHFIEMPRKMDFFDESEYAPTLSHELIHWGAIRNPAVRWIPGESPVETLINMMSGDWPPRDMVVDEVSAEMGAAMLLEWAGVPVGEATRTAYIANWLKRRPDSDRDEVYAEAEKRALDSMAYLLDRAGMNGTEPDYGSDT